MRSQMQWNVHGISSGIWSSGILSLLIWTTAYNIIQRSLTRHCDQLTPCSRTFLEKLTGACPFKKFPVFFGTRRFVTYSQEPANDLPSARHQLNSLHILIPCFFNMQFNILLPSKSSSSKWFSLFSFLWKKMYVFLISCAMSNPSHFPWFDLPHNI